MDTTGPLTRLGRLKALDDRIHAAIAAEEKLQQHRQAGDPNHRFPDKEVRAWARNRGIPVGERGKVHADVHAAYRKAHRL